MPVTSIRIPAAHVALWGLEIMGCRVSTLLELTELCGTHTQRAIWSTRPSQLLVQILALFAELSRSLLKAA